MINKKKETQEGKLFINKFTISKLNSNKLNTIKGGNGDDWTWPKKE